jgi:thiol-disulfide isomerase/thioredoxin
MMTKEMKLALGVAAGVAILFCSSFAFFFTRVEKRKDTSFLANSKSGVALPPSSLVDLNGEPLKDDNLRSGRVMLVFLNPGCGACHTEIEFLKTVVSKRDDLRYYGVASLGNARPDMEAEKQSPFKVYNDQGSRLAIGLGITKIPVKVFVEDGLIKKVWGGASSSDETQLAFVQWLDELQ